MEVNLWYKCLSTVAYPEENSIFGCRENVKEICEEDSTPIKLEHYGGLNEMAFKVSDI